MITEDYVSFETAKLLKEKGFEPPHDYRKWLPNLYTDNGEIKWGVWSDDWYPRITLQMAMKWLREVHNIHISINTVCDGKAWGYEAVIQKQRIPVPSTLFIDWKDTWEEACEAAIKYILENLI